MTVPRSFTRLALARVPSCPRCSGPAGVTYWRDRREPRAGLARPHPSGAEGRWFCGACGEEFFSDRF